MLRRKVIMSVGLVLFLISSQAQSRLPAFKMNERLGRGINMGNSFEAPTETIWGNPWSADYFKIISELGFKHVRLPVRWETTERSMGTAPYTITESFLNRIQQVVDAARKYKLHIIINMHHHEALFENPSAQKARFLSQWSQIGKRFESYSDSLLFEVLNEPHGNVTPAIWNEYFAEALTEIRKTNPTRVVIMGIAEYGGLGAISQLQLPNDDYIILSPHYYNPFPFTHQGAEWVSGADTWQGTKWLDTEAERETVVSEFNYALHFSKVNHIPLHVGEFGAYSKADAESRERWTTFLARWFEEQNLSWAYWEFSAGFGIYDPLTKQYNQSLVDALLKNKMGDATPVLSTPVYTSNFSSGTDGWFLVQQGGAAGTLTTSNGKLNAGISSGGTESWHLQVIKNNIRLEKDKLYKLSFTAQAQADRSINFYAGKASAPWSAYSGASVINSSTAEATYTSTFNMSGPTDPSARLVFDLGKNTNDVMITHVKVEELYYAITNIEEQQARTKVICYPNPAASHLTVEGLDLYTRAEFIDMIGQSYITVTITAGTTVLDIEKIPAGVYVLSLTGNLGNDKIKVIKK